MAEDVKDVNTTEESAVEESQPEIEETEQTSETTDEKQEVQEEQTQPGPVPYDRFKEVNDRMKAAEDQTAAIQQRYYDVVEKVQSGQKPTKEESDLIQKYGGQDAHTREFLRDLDGRIDQRARKVGEEMAAPIIRENEVLKRTVASLQEKAFRTDNTDVERDSPQEREIAQLISMGIPLEKATWAIMGPQRVEGARTKQQVTQKVKTKAKVQANLERGSIPNTSGLPQNRSEDFKQKADRIFREAGM